MSEATTAAKVYPIDSIQWSCRSKNERIYPQCEWSPNFMFLQATSSTHPYLQKLIDYKGILADYMGEITYMALNCYVMLHVYEGFVNIECISTPVEERNKGYATKVMEALVQAAKETGTELRLRATNVTGGGWMIRVPHIVIATGIPKKGKIPTAKLPNWYKKFGFVKVADVKHMGKKAGVNMQFIPDPQK
jgi:GNAT superfamily N-acetyltransferase